MRSGQRFLEGVHRECARSVGTLWRLKATALGAIVMSIPAWSTLSAQGTVPISPDERPAWVVDGVPDSVWMLVEASWTTDDKDLRKETLKRAETHARAASEGHPDDVGRRFALAVVLASRTEIEGGRTKVHLAMEYQREVEAILELDPQHARAHHLLGRLHAGVRRASWLTRWIARNLLGGGELKKATWEAAEEHLGFAEQHAPEVSGHHLQLATLYADTDRLETALQELEHVFPLPIASPIERSVWHEALEVREEWKQRLEREAEMLGCRRVGAPTRPRRLACQ